MPNGLDAGLKDKIHEPSKYFNYAINKKISKLQEKSAADHKDRLADVRAGFICFLFTPDGGLKP